MTLFRSSRLARHLSYALIVALYLLPGTCIPAFSAQPAAARQSILVFPFDMAAQGTPENIVAEFGASVKSSLAGTDGLTVLAFSERLTSVQRAISDGSVKKEEMAGPFSGDKEQKAKALKIAESLATDMALIGSIDEYKYDAAKKQVDITVTAELADVKTGKTLKMVTVTGRSPEGAKATDETELASLAAGDAVSKTVTGIIPDAKPVDPKQSQQKQTAYEPVQKKKPLWKKLLIPVVLGIAVGIAASGGGSDGGGSNLPPGLPD